MPPTITTSLISAKLNPESAKAFLQGSIVFSTKSATKASNLARDNFRTKCFGPLASVVING